MSKANKPKEEKTAEQLEKEQAKELQTLAKKSLSQYLRLNVFSDFSQIPYLVKIELLAKTPSDKVKTRKIGKEEVAYIDYRYAQKALHFLFNGHISNEVLHKDFIEYDEKKEIWEWSDSAKKKVKTGKFEISKVIEAGVVMKYTVKHPDTGEMITRTVSTSHKQYPNPAITRGAALSAAISKSWTAVAYTFGIGADVHKDEESVLDQKFRQAYEAESSDVSDEPFSEETTQTTQPIDDLNFSNIPY